MLATSGPDVPAGITTPWTPQPTERSEVVQPSLYGDLSEETSPDTTRLGLFHTAADVEMWRQRARNGPYRIAWLPQLVGTRGGWIRGLTWGFERARRRGSCYYSRGLARFSRWWG